MVHGNDKVLVPQDAVKRAKFLILTGQDAWRITDTLIREFGLTEIEAGQVYLSALLGR